MEASECAEQMDMTQKQRDREHMTQWTQKSGTPNPLATSVNQRDPANRLSFHVFASVPKFDKIPWLCEASLRNKPLVLSLPRRYPHASATSLNSWRKDVNLPDTFQVPNGLSQGSRDSSGPRCHNKPIQWQEKASVQSDVCGSQDPPPRRRRFLRACLRTLQSGGTKEARRNQRGPVLGRCQQLCSTCQEVKMVQPRTMMIPDDLKHSFENCMSHRMKNLQASKAQTEPRCSPDDIATESIHYRLPLLGPRTGAFHELLSDSYKALRGIQLSSSPRKEPMGKTMRQ